jgi:N-acetylmuramic acid 6-phosphate etherase
MRYQYNTYIEISSKFARKTVLFTGQNKTSWQIGIRKVLFCSEGGNHMAEPMTERLHDLAPGLDDLPLDAIAAHLLTAQTAALTAVSGATSDIARGGQIMADTLAAGGRLIYAAAGSSGLMAMADACELAGTYGVDPGQVTILMAGGLPRDAAMPGGTEDDADEAATAARIITAKDAVILLSASGTTPYALAIARVAQDRGAATIAIANNADVPLFDGATVAICLPTPPELIAGSTRMGAGTAQKVALNMMSTIMGVALGHIHDGMMVNLRADNAKLKARAATMIARITGSHDSMTHLATSKGAVKPAILLAAGARNLDQAEALLAASGGHIRAALAAMKTGA